LLQIFNTDTIFHAALSKNPKERNWEASDMWSFAILLWELATREVPFADLSPMECGMKVGPEIN
jgi:integrin-linked kinase